MPQDPDSLIPGRFVSLEADDTNVRLAALDFALRYPPVNGDVSAAATIADASAYLAFLQGEVADQPNGFNTGDE
jgi:hypothetical protein